MKKITLLFIALLLSFGVFAQFHVTSNFGDIEEGSVITVGTTAMNGGEVTYQVHNDSNEPIFMRIKLVSMENTNEGLTEMCFGQCLYKVQPGSMAPPQNPYPSIDPGETQTTNDDHVWNANDPIDNSQPVSYEIQFQQINGTGTKVLNTLNFTYEYDSTMGVESHQKEVGATIINTIVKDGELNINNQNPVDVQIYNLLGQKVLSEHFNSGSNTINVSDLASQVYLVRFQNKEGQTKTKKIIIK